MRIYPLNKTVLRVSPNAEKFLFGLTSNTLDQPFNAFLNIHGRIVATFEQVQIRADEFLLVVEKSFAETLLKHVARYLPLSQTRMEREDFHVYFDLDGDYRPGAGELGVQHKKGKIIITKSDLPGNISVEEFTRFRLDHNIPWLGIDYQDEFILNVSTSDFVSFTKGCFLGQEPVSKVYNRSQPTWQLAVRYADECAVEEKAKMTSKVQGPDGRIRGFIFSKNIK